MKLYNELVEILGESELADVSMTFWLDYYNVPGKTNTQDAFDKLLAFQNGWLACKEKYKIKDY